MSIQRKSYYTEFKKKSNTVIKPGLYNGVIAYLLISFVLHILQSLKKLFKI
jgi:hypothetical protein